MEKTEESGKRLKQQAQEKRGRRGKMIEEEQKGKYVKQHLYNMHNKL